MSDGAFCRAKRVGRNLRGGRAFVAGKRMDAMSETEKPANINGQPLDRPDDGVGKTAEDELHGKPARGAKRPDHPDDTGANGASDR